MKRILHIAECLGSGVLNYVKNMTKWQVENYEVYVAYATRPETPANFKEQFDSRVHFIHVDGFTREIELKNDIKAFFNIKKIVIEIKPDLIHLHSTKAGVIGRWAVNCNKYKVLYSPHAYSFLMMNCSESKRKLYRLLEKLSDRKKCLTIADIDGEYEASKFVTKNSICIPNGIDPIEMDEIISNANALVQKRQRVTICLSGKIVYQKNPELFNEVAKRLQQYDFLWIGAGPLKEKLTSSNIKVTGWVSRTEATALIMSSDIFLFTSLWESLSIALMEVMYIGKPCVVSRCDGNKDVIRNGVNGFLCDTVEEYVCAIEKLVEDKELRDKVAGKAKQDILEIYNVKEIEKKYRELFTKYEI